MPMQRLGVLAMATFLGVSVSAQALAAESAASPGSFINAAAQAGLMGLESARLAIGISKNAAVKEYAYAMLQDHERMNEELARIAEKRGVAMPPALDARRDAALKSLRNAPVQAFDGQYLAQVVAEHDGTVELLQANLLNADAEVAVFASYNLPREKEHGRRAAELKAGLPASK
jgi:putative membrane protein